MHHSVILWPCQSMRTTTTVVVVLCPVHTIWVSDWIHLGEYFLVSGVFDRFATMANKT